jgi:hypothetical protein
MYFVESHSHIRTSKGDVVCVALIIIAHAICLPNTYFSDSLKAHLGDDELIQVPPVQRQTRGKVGRIQTGVDHVCHSCHAWPNLAGRLGASTL